MGNSASHPPGIEPSVNGMGSEPPPPFNNSSHFRSELEEFGYETEFLFKDGFLISKEDPQRKYRRKDVCYEKKVFGVAEMTVYRITAKDDGYKGYLIERRYEEENYIHFDSEYADLSMAELIELQKSKNK